jgi:hypothetical protein
MSKTPESDRSHGGPGSSHQNADRPATPARETRSSGTPTNDRKSHISGGGGERDLHHTHDPRTKS